MARDIGLEELLKEELGDMPGLSEKTMFGGWALMLNGNHPLRCPRGWNAGSARQR